MSLFDDAMAVGLAAIKDQCGVTAVIRFDGAEISKTVIPGETGVSIDTQQNMRIRKQIRDMLVDVVDLDFGAGPVEPCTGMTFAIGSTTYEVHSPDDDKPWRWHDLGKTRYRIHTREI